jgi:hypothetical protein
MKDSEDKHLQDYLDGTDKVSATYHTVSDEKPSVALDEAILQAARESVADNATQKKAIPLQAYSIAASVCVAVLVVSLFLNNEAELMQNEIGEIEALSIQISDVPADETASADEAATLLQAEPTANTDAGADLSAEEAVADRNRIALPALQAEADNEAAGTAVFSTQAAEQLEMAASLELAPVDFSYRQNSDTWLVQIQALAEAGNEAELAEERRLFAETYPDIDIDSALSELTETN